MNELQDSLDFSWLASDGMGRKMLISAIVIMLLWSAGRILKRIVRKSQDDDLKSQYYWSKGVSYVAFLLGILILSNIWFAGVGSLGTFFGLVGAGLAIALQDPIVDVVAWLFIVVRRPFVVGDRVEIEGQAGDVIDIGVFSFSMLEIGNWVDADQSTGRILQVPNKKVFSSSIANFNQGFDYIWDEINVLVTFESDWKSAKEILLDIAKEHSGRMSDSVRKSVRESSDRYMISYKTLTPIVYTDVKDSGVQLTMRYLCHPKKRRGTKENIWESILARFEEHGKVGLAYPTYRITKE